MAGRAAAATQRRDGGATGESALEILDRRLASGEIDTLFWQAQRDALVVAQGDRK